MGYSIEKCLVDRGLISLCIIKCTYISSVRIIHRVQHSVCLSGSRWWLVMVSVMILTRLTQFFLFISHHYCHRKEYDGRISVVRRLEVFGEEVKRKMVIGLRHLSYKKNKQSYPPPFFSFTSTITTVFCDELHSSAESSCKISIGIFVERPWSAPAVTLILENRMSLLGIHENLISFWHYLDPSSLCCAYEGFFHESDSFW